jgi:hypothetical protein
MRLRVLRLRDWLRLVLYGWVASRVWREGLGLLLIGLGDFYRRLTLIFRLAKDVSFHGIEGEEEEFWTGKGEEGAEREGLV